jgi:hypothetical protein
MLRRKPRETGLPRDPEGLGRGKRGDHEKTRDLKEEWGLESLFPLLSAWRAKVPALLTGALPYVVFLQLGLIFNTCWVR